MCGVWTAYSADSQDGSRKGAEELFEQAKAGVIEKEVGGDKDLVFTVELQTLAPNVVAITSMVLKHVGAAWSERLIQNAVVVVCPDPSVVAGRGTCVATCGATLK